MDYRVIYLFHILIVAPLFVYIWYATNYKKTKLDESIGILMLLFGVVLFFYHAYKLYALQKLMSS